MFQDIQGPQSPNDFIFRKSTFSPKINDCISISQLCHESIDELLRGRNAIVHIRTFIIPLNAPYLLTIGCSSSIRFILSSFIMIYLFIILNLNKICVYPLISIFWPVSSIAIVNCRILYPYIFYFYIPAKN